MRPATVLYFTRHTWLPLIEDTLEDHILPRLPASTTFPFPLNKIRYTPLTYSPTMDDSFAGDAASGLHSSNFNLAGNIEGGDGRAGLDDRAKREVQRLMKRKGLGFDEARSQVVAERFRREGIGADGTPKDPKFVSFS